MALGAHSAGPASEIERLIGDLSASGELIFVFGVGWHTTHLVGTSQPCSAALTTGASGTSNWATTTPSG